VPGELAAVVKLFEASLPDVTFPDVDAKRLRGLATEVQRTTSEVERAREALAAAERAATEATEALRAAAHRGLAYARVFADADPARQSLRAALDEIHAATTPAAGKPAVSPTGKKRGRPRKVQPDPLFTIAPVEAASSAPAARAE
jgi:hypothetical protein